MGIPGSPRSDRAGAGGALPRLDDRCAERLDGGSARARCCSGCRAARQPPRSPDRWRRRLSYGAGQRRHPPVEFSEAAHRRRTREGDHVDAAIEQHPVDIEFGVSLGIDGNRAYAITSVTMAPRFRSSSPMTSRPMSARGRRSARRGRHRIRAVPAARLSARDSAGDQVDLDAETREAFRSAGADGAQLTEFSARTSADDTNSRPMKESTAFAARDTASRSPRDGCGLRRAARSPTAARYESSALRSGWRRATARHQVHEFRSLLSRAWSPARACQTADGRHYQRRFSRSAATRPTTGMAGRRSVLFFTLRAISARDPTCVCCVGRGAVVDERRGVFLWTSSLQQCVQASRATARDLRSRQSCRRASPGLPSPRRQRVRRTFIATHEGQRVAATRIGEGHTSEAGRANRRRNPGTTSKRIRRSCRNNASEPPESKMNGRPRRGAPRRYLRALSRRAGSRWLPGRSGPAPACRRRSSRRRSRQLQHARMRTRWS